MTGGWTPAEVLALLAGGRRDALLVLGALASGGADADAEALAKSMLPAGTGDAGLVLAAGAILLLAEALAGHGEDLAAWTARKQVEDAAGPVLRARQRPAVFSTAGRCALRGYWFPPVMAARGGGSAARAGMASSDGTGT